MNFSFENSVLTNCFFKKLLFGCQNYFQLGVVRCENVKHGITSELLFCLRRCHLIRGEKISLKQKESALYSGAFYWGAYGCVKWALLSEVLMSVHAPEKYTTGIIVARMTCQTVKLNFKVKRPQEAPSCNFNHALKLVLTIMLTRL